MKRIFTLALCLVSSISLWSQSPQAFNYQAVARGATGAPLANQSVSFQVSIHESSPTGTSVYVETHQDVTNDFGLANLAIGQGTVVLGTFSGIAWGNDSHYLEIEFDPNGGSAYLSMGTSQMLSVPYALHASTVEFDNVEDADSDPGNELQTLIFSNDTLSISDGNFVLIPGGSDNQVLAISNDTLSIEDGNGVDLSVYLDNTDAQTLTVSNDSLFISGGNAIDLSAFLDDTDTDDQNLSLSNDSLLIDDGAGVDLAGFLDNTDEQDLTVSNDSLFISGGNGVDLSVFLDDTDTDDQNLSLSNDSLLIDDGAGVDLAGFLDNTDEQTLSLSGNTLSITDGNSVNLSTFLDDTDTDDQTLSFSAPNLTISDGNSVDLSGLDDGDWEILSGTNMANVNEGNVGIGDMASSQLRWKLTVKDTVDCMLGTDSVDVSELHGAFIRNLNENNTGIGIGFQSTTSVTGMGAAIVHERTNSNSRGKLHFATKASGSAADEDLPIRMTLDETGDLGIGTTEPNEKLHVDGGNMESSRGSSTGSTTRYLTLGGAQSGDSQFARIDFENYDSNGSSSDYIGASIRVNNGGDASDKGNLRFLTYNSSLTERMRITDEGLVGIGETDPQASLDVVDQAVIGNLSVGSESTDQGTSNNTGLGYTVTPWLYTNAIEAQGERGTGSTLITVGNDGTYGSDDQIHFVTSGDDQVTIASDGKVGFDQASPSADLHIRQSQQSITNGTGGIRFEDSADASDWWRTYHSGIYYSFNWQGARVAYIETNGTYVTTSDRRFKKNIDGMQSVLGRVKQLRPVSYHYKRQDEGSQKVLGFIAQEVQPLFPEVVFTGEDGSLGMGYAHMGVISIKAVQEQQEIIEDQEAKIEEMEGQMAKMMQQMKAMQQQVQALQNTSK